MDYSSLDASGLSRRRIARVAYLALFVGIQYLTPIFEQYPPLLWLGIAGLVVVFFDAVICARRRWQVVKKELGDDSDAAEPG